MQTVKTFFLTKRTIPTWLISIAIMFLLFIGHATGGSSTSYTGTSVATTARQSSPTPVHQVPTATPKPASKTIATFSGTTSKNTPNFTVMADQWTLAWSCQGGAYGGNLSVEIDNAADGSIFDPGAVNVVCDGTMHDSTLERQAGSFYLTVMADVTWTITIVATQ